MAQDPDLTPEEVAAELRLTYDTVLRALRAGDLPGYKADQRQWRIGRAELDAFKKAGGVRSAGRPRKDTQAPNAQISDTQTPDTENAHE